MNVTANQRGQSLVVPVAENLEVTIFPHQNEEWLMSTAEVARGYGVNVKTVHSHKSNHADELIKGVHYHKASDILGSLDAVSFQQHEVIWTKAGVIRLGFFVKSERAKQFRDWAERVVLAVTAPTVNLPVAKPRKHNRLTQSRLVELLSLVALVEDADLRQQLVMKLNPDAASVQLKLANPQKTEDHA